MPAHLHSLQEQGQRDRRCQRSLRGSRLQGYARPARARVHYGVKCMVVGLFISLAAIINLSCLLATHLLVAYWDNWDSILSVRTL